MGPHLCGHPVVQQAPCFPASTGPLRRRRLTEAYRPLLINYDYTCGGIHICIHPTAPTEIHKYVVKWHISVHIISTLKGKGGSQRGEVSGALTDWLLGCLWRQHMWEECAGLVGFFFGAYLIKNQWIHRFCGSFNVLNIHLEKQTQLVKCHCVELMSLKR